MLRRLLTLTALLATIVGSAAIAAEPPNQNDPCSRGGRNTCGTTGVGLYKTYRYGLRWFGDYRGAVPRRGRRPSASTCASGTRRGLPLREATRRGRCATARARRCRPEPAADGLRDVELRAHATTAPAGRGDALRARPDGRRRARRGRPGARSPGRRARSTRASPATRRATTGPTARAVDLPDGAAGRRSRRRSTVRVLAPPARSCPTLRLTLDRRRARGGLPTTCAPTPPASRASRSRPPTRDGGVRSTSTQRPLASTLPDDLRAAARAPPRATASASPRRRRRRSATAATAGRAQAQLDASRRPPRPRRCWSARTARDSVDALRRARRAGAARRRRASTGRSASPAEIRCDGAPAREGTFTAARPGTYTTPPRRADAAGLVRLPAVLPATRRPLGATTPCDEPAERVRGRGAAGRVTQVSSQTTRARRDAHRHRDRQRPGRRDGDRPRRPLRAVPDAPRRCPATGRRSGRARFTATGDGEYLTEPVTLTVPGYYTYRESIAASELRARRRDAVRRRAETTVVPRHAAARDADQRAGGAPGRHDHRHRGRQRPRRARPRPSRSSCGARSRRARRSRCTGTPVWTGTLHRQRRRHVHDRSRDARRGPATTPTASRSPRRAADHGGATAAARPPRRRSSRRSPR